MAETVSLATDEVSANVAVADKTAALARFWSAALEAESLYDIRVPRMPGVPSAVSLPIGRETAMYASNRELVLNIEDSEIDPFVKVYGGGKLIYGYPVLAYPDGALRPMFTLRATVKGNLLQLESHAPRINQGLLQDMRISPTEMAAVIEELEGATFEQAIARICELLHCDPKRFAADALEPGFENCDGNMTWFNRPVLAAATMNSATATCVRELTELASDMRSDVADRTALAAFEEDVPPVTDGQLEVFDGPMVFDIHHLGPSQTQFARAGMNQRLSISGAMPGSGQMAAIVNLIATAVMQESSVLYVAKRPETLAAMAKHIDGWIGRGNKVVVHVGRRKALNQTYSLIQATLRKLLAEEAGEKEAEQPKRQREKPTLKDLQELDRLPSNTDALLQSIREIFAQIAELTINERMLAYKLDAGWAGPSARKAPTPKASMLRDWRTRLSGAGEGGGGFGGFVKSMFSRNGGRDGLIAEIRIFIGRMPAAVKAAALEAIGDGKSDEKVEAALKMLDEFGAWKILVDKRSEAIRKLVRLRDGRSIELQALNQAARKVSGVRELFRDSMRERLLADVATLEKQVSTFFELVGERDYGQDESHRAHRSQRLAQAQQILARTLPVWTGTPAEVGQSLPLEPAVFDLVIIDEAEQLDLGSVLPLLYRAQRAVLIGAPRSSSRITPLNENDIESSDSGSLPAWAASPGLSALGALGEWLKTNAGSALMLSDHFRSHPVIADYLSSVFYDHGMVVRSNYRKLREGVGERYLGLHWHEVGIQFSAAGDGPKVGSEIDTAETLLKAWDEDGLFELAPRRSVGVVSPHLSQVELLQERIRRSTEVSPSLRERVTIALPDAFAGRQVDVLIMLTGIATVDGDSELPSHADDETLFHDALGAARLSVHVIGNREACRESGSFAAALAGFCSHDDLHEADGPSYDDEFERRLDSAFSVTSGDGKDPLPVLKKDLDQLGLPYQENIMEQDVAMLIRVLAPLGGRYNIEISKPVADVKSERELRREAERDEKARAMGYVVLRLYPEEILNRSDFLMERLRRMV